jgi:hypothetical protein
MADQWFGDLAEVEVDGNPVTVGTGITIAEAWKKATAPANWSTPETDKPVSVKCTIIIPCVDVDDHAEFKMLRNYANAKVAKTFVLYPEGNTAGKLAYTGTGFISVSGLDSGIDKAATFTLTIDVKGDLVLGDNIVLSTLNFGAVAAGGAASGYTAPTASGGTAAYTITMADENGKASALPEGVTWSGSAFAGTVDVGANVGIYRVKVKVVDSDTPANTRYYLGTMEVTA